MSLLLKALENAAKNREAAATAGEPSSPAEPEVGTPELSLEPMPQPTRAQSNASGQAPSRSNAKNTAVDDERGADPQQAQTVLQAGAASARSSVFDWLAQRPLIAFSTAAGIFAIGYGTYLYLQITNPGIFTARPPLVAKPPISPAPPPAVQSPAPPPLAGLDTSVAPGSVSGPAPDLAALPATPAPGAAPTSSSDAPSVSSPAPQPPAPVAKGPAPAAPAKQAGAEKSKINGAPAQGDAPKATPPRAPRATTARQAAKPVPSESVAPSSAGVVIPVSATLVSAHQTLEKGQLDEAERLYRQSLAADPRSIDAMLGLAATLTQQNKGEAATQFYLRVLEQDPRNAHAQAGLLNLGGRADPAGAEARLKQLIAREPSAFLYFSLGNLYADQGHWAGAQSAYFQAHNLAPDNPDYAFNLAVGLEHVSQPKIALTYYRRAVALAQSRGNAQFDATRVQSRIRSLETALAEKP